MSKRHTNGHNVKKMLGVWAEPDFFDAVDRLRKAEKPVQSRSQFIQRLVYQAAAEAAHTKQQSAA